MMQDCSAETAGRSLLDGDEHLVVPRELPHQVLIEWLGEARIGDGGGEPEGGELVACFQRLAEPRPEGEDGDDRALAEDSPLAEGEDLASLGQGHSGAL